MQREPAVLIPAGHRGYVILGFAYEFAKGKPLTLPDGSNLLYLLKKHGHKAKIDLKEARKILNNQ